MIQKIWFEWHVRKKKKKERIELELHSTIITPTLFKIMDHVIHFGWYELSKESNDLERKIWLCYRFLQPEHF